MDPALAAILALALALALALLLVGALNCAYHRGAASTDALVESLRRDVAAGRVALARAEAQLARNVAASAAPLEAERVAGAAGAAGAAGDGGTDLLLRALNAGGQSTPGEPPASPTGGPST